ncbi:hypothetical protein N7523_005771 [Penicillium sp. IBT 18751x]|nr:hypothetical protein N7523_005637 [Penicillium sp. IBT 18751x]KAJ6118020.1 hypothetical protein N7523_005771 [Penicillium sp. IBT 18751x]
MSSISHKPHNQIKAIKREGLTQVYPNGDKKGIVNIVFVHGLQGHPLETWAVKKTTAQRLPNDKKSDASTPSWLPQTLALFSKPEPTAIQEGEGSRPYCESLGPDDVFWPSVEVPKVVPEANIFTYGYNCNVDNLNEYGMNLKKLDNSLDKEVSNSLNILSADSHTPHLWENILLLREVSNAYCIKLPIIFVAYNLGGILVKSAIVQSKELSSRVHAVLFCGTPHLGVDDAALLKLPRTSETEDRQSCNDKLIKELQKNSESLGSIHNGFLQVLHHAKGRIQIHSFQESRGLSRASRKVVDDSSSQLGYPYETKETIDANHIDMVLVGANKISRAIKSCVRRMPKSLRG